MTERSRKICDKFLEGTFVEEYDDTSKESHVLWKWTLWIRLIDMSCRKNQQMLLVLFSAFPPCVEGKLLLNIQVFTTWVLSIALFLVGVRVNSFLFGGSKLIAGSWTRMLRNSVWFLLFQKWCFTSNYLYYLTFSAFGSEFYKTIKLKKFSRRQEYDHSFGSEKYFWLFWFVPVT